MLDRIKACLPSLAPAEQRVGRLVLSDPRSFAKLPVSELADRAHVSKPTVVRFCRSVGYDGLSDFKLKLAGSVNEGVPFIHRSVDADDKTGDIMVKVIDNTVAAFLKYRNDASTAVIEKEQQRVRKPSPRYKVLLHNDPVNSMEYVVSTLRQVVPSLSEQDAIAVMLEAHNTGVGLVIVCDIEPAEFYSETLKAKGLTSTIEPES